MSTVLWKMPVPSSGTSGAHFRQLGGRVCEIALDTEGPNGGNSLIRLLFRGVEVFRCTYLSSLGSIEKEAADAYDTILSLENSSWLTDVRNHFTPGYTNTKAAQLRHLIIKFDGGPCFEFICTSFDVDAGPEITPLYRPVGPKELALIRQADWSRYPTRLPGQPIFYPVVTEKYARKIASDWNVRDSGAGFVTKFAIATKYIQQFDAHFVGGSAHAEYWIPAEELEEFNRNIVGKIEVIAEYHAEDQSST